MFKSFMQLHAKTCPHYYADTDVADAPCGRDECRAFVLRETRVLLADALVLISASDHPSQKVWSEKFRQLAPYLQDEAFGVKSS